MPFHAGWLGDLSVGSIPPPCPPPADGDWLSEMSARRLPQWAARGVCGARGVAGPATAAAAAPGGGGARLGPGREEAEEDVARGGEMAAENKPEGESQARARRGRAATAA